MANLPPVIILQKEQTQDLFSLESRTAGTYDQQMSIDGNSLLSSVFVKSCDAGTTVQVNYWETTSGDVTDPERVPLAEHRLLASVDVGLTDKILVGRIHNKPRVEVIVSGGGQATFGVYISVRSETASDIDTALHLDNSVTDILVDKGIPVMCYDETLGKFFFLRCPLEVNISDGGDGVFSEFQTISTPGVEQTLITTTVPALTVRHLERVLVTSRHPGKYTLSDGSAIIASGRTGAAHMQDLFMWKPRRDIPAGTTLTLKYTADGSAPASDVEAYFMASDETA